MEEYKQEDDPEYRRVAGHYEKKSEYPVNADENIFESRWIKWPLSNIITDHGREFLKKISSFDNYFYEPSHINYLKIKGRYINQYLELSHLVREGSIKTTLQFVKHIFQDQYELGLDYLQILYLHPKQKLPMLLLLSAENKTGKSTFLKFLKAIFQDNAYFANTFALKSNFNADWVRRLLICIDETLIEDRALVEQLKYLCTSLVAPIEAKNKDRVETPFYGKIIMASNNVNDAIQISQEESRLWAIDVKPVEGERDVHLMEKLESETPAFLHYLSQRKLKTQNSDRLWFDTKLIETEALRRLKKNSRSEILSEFESLAKDIFNQLNVDSFQFSCQDLNLLLPQKYSKYTAHQFKNQILSYYKTYSPDNPSTYTRITKNHDDTYSKAKAQGRFHTITREDFKNTLT